MIAHGHIVVKENDTHPHGLNSLHYITAHICSLAQVEVQPYVLNDALHYIHYITPITLHPLHYIITHICSSAQFEVKPYVLDDSLHYITPITSITSITLHQYTWLLACAG